MEFGDFSCPENNAACLRLLCQWQRRGEDDMEKCDEVAENENQRDANFHESDKTEKKTEKNEPNTTEYVDN